MRSIHTERSAASCYGNTVVLFSHPHLARKAPERWDELLASLLRRIRGGVGMSIATTPPTLDVALELAAAGISVVPINTDGSKEPSIKWGKYQQRIATADEINRWFRQLGRDRDDWWPSLRRPGDPGR